MPVMGDTKKCRICLAGEVINWSTQSSEMTVSYENIYWKYTKLNRKTRKQLPPYICNGCGKSLESSYNFLQKCLKTDAVLCAEQKKHVKNHFETVIIKTDDSLQSDKKVECNIIKNPIDLKDISITKCQESFVENDLITTRLNTIDWTKTYLNDDNLKEQTITKRNQFSNSTIKEEESQNILDDSPLSENQSFDDIPMDNIEFEENPGGNNSDKDGVLDAEPVNFGEIHSNENIAGELKKCTGTRNTLVVKGKINKSIVRSKTKKSTKKCEWTCSHCQKVFNNRDKMRSHYIKMHKERNVLCHHCPLLFKDNYTLKRHISARHSSDEIKKELKFACHLCSRKFSANVYLQNHLPVHDADRKPTFKCPLCDKMCISKTTLNSHKRTHDASNAYKCSFCDKSFYGRVDLERHVRVHTGERPYSCEICKKTFQVTSQLYDHKRKHEGFMYKCDLCESEFKSRLLLKTHRVQHVGFPMKCGICHKGFTNTYRLRRHLNGVHKIICREECNKWIVKIELNKKYRRPDILTNTQATDSK